MTVVHPPCSLGELAGASSSPPAVWVSFHGRAPPAGLTLPEYAAPLVPVQPFSPTFSPTPSVGSALHGAGCQPCAWFWKAGGCQREKDCLHCHTCSSGEIKRRKQAKIAAFRAAEVVTPKSSVAPLPLMGQPLPIHFWMPLPPAFDYSGHSPSPYQMPFSEYRPPSNPPRHDADDEHAGEASGLALPLAGARPPPGIPSIGSSFHGTGEGCRPCIWFYKASGCQREHSCFYCHLCPKGEVKARKQSKDAMHQEPTMMFKGAAVRLNDSDEKRGDTGVHSWVVGPPPGLSFGLLEQAALDAQSVTGNTTCCSTSDDLGDLEVVIGSTSSEEASLAELEYEDPVDVRHGEALDRADFYFRAPDAESEHSEESQIVELGARQPNISKGSSLHGTGVCRPCAWFWKPEGCQHEQKCFYCHLCPPGSLKARKQSKNAMLRAANNAASDRLGRCPI